MLFIVELPCAPVHIRGRRRRVDEWLFSQVQDNEFADLGRDRFGGAPPIYPFDLVRFFAGRVRTLRGAVVRLVLLIVESPLRACAFEADGKESINTSLRCGTTSSQTSTARAWGGPAVDHFEPARFFAGETSYSSRRGGKPRASHPRAALRARAPSRPTRRVDERFSQVWTTSSRSRRRQHGGAPAVAHFELVRFLASDTLVLFRGAVKLVLLISQAVLRACAGARHDAEGDFEPVQVR